MEYSRHGHERRFKDVVAAQIAASDFDQGALSRLDYWIEVFGEHEIMGLNGTHESADSYFPKFADSSADGDGPDGND